MDTKRRRLFIDDEAAVSGSDSGDEEPESNDDIYSTHSNSCDDGETADDGSHMTLDSENIRKETEQSNIEAVNAVFKNMTICDRFCTVMYNLLNGKVADFNKIPRMLRQCVLGGKVIVPKCMLQNCVLLPYKFTKCDAFVSKLTKASFDERKHLTDYLKNVKSKAQHDASAVSTSKVGNEANDSLKMLQSYLAVKSSTDEMILSEEVLYSQTDCTVVDKGNFIFNSITVSDTALVQALRSYVKDTISEPDRRKVEKYIHANHIAVTLEPPVIYTDKLQLGLEMYARDMQALTLFKSYNRSVEDMCIEVYRQHNVFADIKEDVYARFTSDEVNPFAECYRLYHDSGSQTSPVLIKGFLANIQRQVDTEKAGHNSVVPSQSFTSPDKASKGHKLLVLANDDRRMRADIWEMKQWLEPSPHFKSTYKYFFLLCDDLALAKQLQQFHLSLSNQKQFKWGISVVHNNATLAVFEGFKRHSPYLSVAIQIEEFCTVNAIEGVPALIPIQERFFSDVFKRVFEYRYPTGSVASDVGFTFGPTTHSTLIAKCTALLSGVTCNVNYVVLAKVIPPNLSQGGLLNWLQCVRNGNLEASPSVIQSVAWICEPESQLVSNVKQLYQYLHWYNENNNPFLQNNIGRLTFAVAELLFDRYKDIHFGASFVNSNDFVKTFCCATDVQRVLLHNGINPDEFYGYVCEYLVIGRKRHRNLIFSGLPLTGKTMLANALIDIFSGTRVSLDKANSSTLSFVIASVNNKQHGIAVLEDVALETLRSLIDGSMRAQLDGYSTMANQKFDRVKETCWPPVLQTTNVPIRKRPPTASENEQYFAHDTKSIEALNLFHSRHKSLEFTNPLTTLGTRIDSISKEDMLNFFLSKSLPDCAAFYGLPDQSNIYPCQPGRHHFFCKAFMRFETTANCKIFDSSCKHYRIKHELLGIAFSADNAAALTRSFLHKYRLNVNPDTDDEEQASLRLLIRGFISNVWLPIAVLHDRVLRRPIKCELSDFNYVEDIVALQPTACFIVSTNPNILSTVYDIDHAKTSFGNIFNLPVEVVLSILSSFDEISQSSMCQRLRKRLLRSFHLFKNKVDCDKYISHLYLEWPDKTDVFYFEQVLTFVESLLTVNRDVTTSSHDTDLALFI